MTTNASIDGVPSPLIDWDNPDDTGAFVLGVDTASDESRLSAVLLKSRDRFPEGTSLGDAIRGVIPPTDEQAVYYFQRALERMLDDEWERSANDFKFAQRDGAISGADVLRSLLHIENAKELLAGERKNCVELAREEFKTALKLAPAHEAVLAFRPHLVQRIQKINEQHCLRKDKRAEERKEQEKIKADINRQLAEEQREQRRLEAEERLQAERQRNEAEQKQRAALQQQRKEERKNASINAAAGLFEKAKEFAKQKDLPQVITLLEQVCQLAPDNTIYQTKLAECKKRVATFHIKKAQVFFSQQRFKEAGEEVNRVLALTPDDAVATKIRNSIQFQDRLPQLFAVADAHLAGGNFQKAREVYGSILNSDPSNVQANKGLVECRRLEVKRRLIIPARLLYLQWFCLNGLAIYTIWGIINQENGSGNVGWFLLLPAQILFCGPICKGWSLSSLKNSESFHVSNVETLYGLLFYLPFGWLGIFWARIALAFDPKMKEVFADQVELRSHMPPPLP